MKRGVDRFKDIARMGRLIAWLMMAALLLSGCRFMVVETEPVRIEAPLPTQR